MNVTGELTNTTTCKGATFFVPILWEPHYGLLANRGRQAKLKLCRVLLQQPKSAARPVPPDTQAPPAPDQPAAVCPACQRGRMSWVETLRRQPDLFDRWMQPPGEDTS